MRIGRVFVAAAVVGLGVVAAPGCYTNSCLLTVCDGPYCRCSVSACGEGASYDSRIARCRCLPGRALVGGQCLSPRVASAYCGAGFSFRTGAAMPTAAGPATSSITPPTCASP